MTEGYENRSNFLGGLWPFWLILALALGVRLFWLILFQGQIGVDAVRYLWISEHVTRGEWRLLPQLYTSPLLPGAVGLLSRLTGDNLLTGRVLCLLANTAAVGLGMLLVLKIFPRRPMLYLADGTRIGLQSRLVPDHRLCSHRQFVYPSSLSLFLLALLLEGKATWSRGLAFGLLWALAYLARDIGLYCGAAVFLILLAVKLWKTRGLAPKTSALVRLARLAGPPPPGGRLGVRPLSDLRDNFLGRGPPLLRGICSDLRPQS